MSMTVEELLKKRKQTRLYNVNKTPDKALVESLIDKTFHLTPSKQSLMPYKIDILGPECVEYKEKFFKLSKTIKGGGQNYNHKAPYVLIFTRRLVTNPNDAVKKKIALGHPYGVCDALEYKKFDKDVGIEIGMFSKVLTALCLESNIDVSYLLCFPLYNEDKRWKQLDFIKDDVLFSMQLGFKSELFTYETHIGEKKPEKNEVITWI
jgi:hypothetical protein